jgi:hypothetical protein
MEELLKYINGRLNGENDIIRQNGELIRQNGELIRQINELTNYIRSAQPLQLFSKIVYSYIYKYHKNPP